MDFIIRLPESHDYNTILVIVDRLSKERYYIIYIDKNNGTSIENTVKILIEYI